MSEGEAIKLVEELTMLGWTAYKHAYCGSWEVIVSGRAKRRRTA